MVKQSSRGQLDSGGEIAANGQAGFQTSWLERRGDEEEESPRRKSGAVSALGTGDSRDQLRARNGGAVRAAARSPSGRRPLRQTALR